MRNGWNVVILLFGQSWPGMSSFSVPPSATLKIWSPLQIAKIGSPRSSACLTAANSQRSRVGIDILFEHGWIGDRLAKKFRGDVGSAGKEQTIGIVERYFAAARVRNCQFGMRRKEWAETISHPSVESKSPVSASRKVRAIMRM